MLHPAEDLLPKAFAAIVFVLGAFHVLRIIWKVILIASSEARAELLRFVAKYAEERDAWRGAIIEIRKTMRLPEATSRCDSIEPPLPP